MLVAIVGVYAPAATTTCTAGPTGGFDAADLRGAGSEPLPQCLDGGADAAATS